MLAHHHGQTWNSSDLARSFGVADHTVRRCLDIIHIAKETYPLTMQIRAVAFERPHEDTRPLR